MRQAPKSMKFIQQSKAPPDARKSNEGESIFPPPDRLSPTQAGIWRELTATIILRPCDLFMVEQLVCLIDQQRLLQADLNKSGPIDVQNNGQPKHHIAATALRKIEAQLTRGFKELGMTPATRARLRLDNQTNESESEWAGF